MVRISEFHAEARVNVVANTAPFRKQFADALRDVDKTAQVSVTVVPSTAGFIKELRTQLRAMKLPPVRLLVEPDMRGFKTKLRKAVTEAAKGVPIPVAVAPASTAPAKGATAATSTAAKAAATTSRAVTLEQKLAGAVDAATFSRKRLAASLSAEEKLTERLVRQKAALAAAAKVEKAALDAQNATIYAQAQALRKAQEAAVAKTVSAQDKAAAPERRAAAAAAAAAAEVKAAETAAKAKATADAKAAADSKKAAEALTAQKIRDAEIAAAAEIKAAEEAATAKAAAQTKADKAAQKIRTESAKAFAAREAELEKQRNRQVASSTKKRAAYYIQEAKARIAATTASSSAQAAGLEQARKFFAAEETAAAKTAKERMTLIKQEALARNAAFTKAQKQIAAARAKIVAAQTVPAGVTPRAAASQQAKAAASAATKAQTALTSAIATGNKALIAQARETLAAATAIQTETAELVQNTRAQVANTAAQTKRGKAQKQAFRGAASTGLTALGARGATLAAGGPFLAGAATAVTIGASIKAAADFEKQLNIFGATAEATAQQVGLVSEEARKLGRDITLPGVSAQSAAKAMTELAKAGLNVRDSMDGARGTLQLATAAGIETAEATELVANALNSFGLSGKAAVSVADLLANASIQAQGSIVDMGIALRQSSSVARQVGLTLNETVSILTLLAKNGLSASDAGTSLRTGILRLASPTKKASDLLKQLGINVRDAQGRFRVESFFELAEALNKFKGSTTAAGARDIFGQDAIRIFSIMGREGPAAFAAIEKGNERAGAAAKLATAQTQGFGGSLENLKNQAQAAGQAIGSDLIGPAGSFIDTIAGGLGAVADVLSPGKDPFGLQTQSATLLIDRIVALNEASQILGSNLERIAASEAANIGEKQLTGIGKRLVAQGRLDLFFAAFKGGSEQIRKAMQDNIITPSEKAALEATRLGRAFVKALPRRFFTGLGAGIRSGLEDASAAARAGVEDTGEEIRSGIEDASRQAAAEAQTGGKKVGESFAIGLRDARNAIFDAIKGIEGQLRGLDEEFDKAVVAGSDKAKRAVLVRKEGRLEGIIKRAGPDAKGTLLDKRRQAQKDLAGVTEQIRAMDEEAEREAEQAEDDRKAKAKKKSDDAERKRSEADQAFFDSLEPGRAALERRGIRADETPGLQDNLKLQRDTRALIKREMALIKKTVQDKKDQAAALRERVTELVTVNATIRGLRKQIRENAQAEVQAQRDTIFSALQSRIELAGLRGNKANQLRLIDQAIADRKKEVNRLKRLGKATTDVEIQIEQLIDQRKELQNKAEEGNKQGTTAFDLLSQFTGTFNQTAGNLVGPDQPFVSPSSFTSKIQPFLTRKPADRNAISFNTGGTPDSTDRAIDRLIDALNANTAATQGNSAANAAPFSMPNYVNVTGQRAQAMAKFWEARGAREAVQG